MSGPSGNDVGIVRARYSIPQGHLRTRGLSYNSLARKIHRVWVCY